MHPISDMMRVSLAQLIVTALLVAGFAIFVGQAAAVTAFLVGLAYVVPTVLLAAYIFLTRRVATVYKDGVLSVLFGELVKLLVIIVLWVIIVRNYENLHWPAFITTIIAVANSYFIVLFKRN